VSGAADSVIRGDVNGDGAADLEILVKAVSPTSWDSLDFIL
jgi:hypothetical protein